MVKNAIAPAAHRMMISNVKNSPAFSLLMDESTDRGVENMKALLSDTMMNLVLLWQLDFLGYRRYL